MRSKRQSKRQKASDVFAANPPLLGATSSFAKAFPAIKAVKAMIEERDSGGVVHEHYFSAGSLPGEYLDCANPRCYKGGYRIGQTLRFLETSRQRHFEDHQPCCGYEGSPKGRKRYGPCDHSFKVTVDLKFYPQKPKNK